MVGLDTVPMFVGMGLSVLQPRGSGALSMATKPLPAPLPQVSVIVLAGGEGTRLCPLIDRWLGRRIPKQYCAFYGKQTLLDHTLRRARQLAVDSRIVTIIGAGHRQFIEAGHETEFPGLLIEQPSAKDTGPGVFLPLCYLRARDPEATVVILPSDHFIYPEEGFRDQMSAAVQVVEAYPDRLLLLSAEPHYPEPDYGWIQPGDPLVHEGCRPREVRCFREKPTRELAELYLQAGFLWNTLITVAKAETLWNLGLRLVPEAMRRYKLLYELLTRIRRGVDAAESEMRFIARIYETLEPFNFSDRILEGAYESCLVLPLTDVAWSDLGRPQRVIETLSAAGQKSNLPDELVKWVSDQG